jgi:hypothetical protein
MYEESSNSNWLTDLLKPLVEGKWDAAGAIGGSALGLGGAVGGIIDWMNQSKAQKAFKNTANAPVNWQQFYNPMSTDYQRILRNSAAAEMAARGIPIDSMAATSMIGDVLANKNNELMTKAMELGNQARGTQLSGLQASGTQNPNYANILGSIGKFMQPLASYASNQRVLAARKQLEDRYMGGPGQAVNSRFKFGINPPDPGSFYEQGIPGLTLGRGLDLSNISTGDS